MKNKNANGNTMYLTGKIFSTDLSQHDLDSFKSNEP